MNIGVIGNISKPGVPEIAGTALSLFTARGHRLLFDEKLAQALGRPSGLSDACLAEETELILALGGDGTVLRAVRAAVPLRIPVLGIHMGTLGFLCEVRPGTLEEASNAITEGAFEIEHRTMLEACGNGHAVSALNDVTLTRNRFSCIMRLKLYVDGEYAGAVDCDGMLVATPTGSTSYSMSIGGPLLHPSLNAFAIVPMAAHVSGLRPMVISADSTVTITSTQNGESIVTADGCRAFSVSGANSVNIRKAAQSAMFIRLKPHRFFEVVRERIYGQSEGYESKETRLHFGDN